MRTPLAGHRSGAPGVRHNRPMPARRVRPDRALLHPPGATRRARRRRRLRAARAGAGHAAGGVERHAGRGPALPVDRRARAARPQGAGGQPERPGRLRRASRWRSRWRWRCRASTRPSCDGFARRPARAGRRARHRAGRRRHHGRAADHRASPCSARCRPARRCCAAARAPATTSGSAARLGDARLALEVFRGTRRAAAAMRSTRVRRAMERPQPRVALGLALRGVAHAARSTLSDGLLGDLGHVLRALGRRRRASRSTRCRAAPRWPRSRCALQRDVPLAGGDDYELLFTAPASARDGGAARGARAGVRGDAASAASRPTPGLRLRRRPTARRRRGRRAASTTSQRMTADRPAVAATAGCAPRRARRALPAARTRRTGSRSASAAACRRGAGHRRHAVGLARVRAAASRWLDDLAVGRCCSAVARWSAGGPARAPRSDLRHGRPGRHRVGRGARVLDRAVAGDAGGLVGPAGGLRAVPPLRRRQAGPGGAGPTRCSRRAPATRSAGARASASCSTTWWPRCARCW